MIFEALSAIKDSNGCDVGTIVNFIEVRWRFTVIFICRDKLISLYLEPLTF